MNLANRCGQFRVDRTAVLAAEPGSYALERERHMQFVNERLSRREDFEPSERLLEHIADIRARYGAPTMIGWTNGWVENHIPEPAF